MKNMLLATTAVVAIYGGTANAADLPLKAAAPAIIPVSNWTGPYIGAHIGIGRMNESAHATDNHQFIGSPCGPGYNSACAGAATGVVGGVEIGYDWQDRYFVYGVAADWTWTDLKETSARVSGTSAFTWHHQAKIEWLASFRGRMGLAVDNTLVYLTGGLALGQLKSSVGLICTGARSCSEPSQSSTGNYGTLNTVKVGWVVGGGIEHKWTRNWSFKAEALYYDLGREKASGNGTIAPPVPNGAYTTDFHHEVIVGRVGVNYRF